MGYPEKLTFMNHLLKNINYVLYTKISAGTSPELPGRAGQSPQPPREGRGYQHGASRQRGMLAKED